MPALRPPAIIHATQLKIKIIDIKDKKINLLWQRFFAIKLKSGN